MDFLLEAELFGGKKYEPVVLPDDPVAELFEKLDHEAFSDKCPDVNWLASVGNAKQANAVRKRATRVQSEANGTPAPHADGTFAERDGDCLWELTYKGGELVRQVARHADGVVQYFDADGIEVSCFLKRKDSFMEDKENEHQHLLA